MSELGKEDSRWIERLEAEFWREQAVWQATLKENGRLEGALRKYGEHTPDCGKWDKMDSGQLFARHDWKCTCGFEEALSPTQEVDDECRD